MLARAAHMNSEHRRGSAQRVHKWTQLDRFGASAQYQQNSKGQGFTNLASFRLVCKRIDQWRVPRAPRHYHDREPSMFQEQLLALLAGMRKGWFGPPSDGLATTYDGM